MQKVQKGMHRESLSPTPSLATKFPFTWTPIYEFLHQFYEYIFPEILYISIIIGRYGYNLPTFT